MNEGTNGNRVEIPLFFLTKEQISRVFSPFKALTTEPPQPAQWAYIDYTRSTTELTHLKDCIESVQDSCTSCDDSVAKALSLVKIRRLCIQIPALTNCYGYVLKQDPSSTLDVEKPINSLNSLAYLRNFKVQSWIF